VTKRPGLGYITDGMILSKFFGVLNYASNS
jgi:hypothetical protein